MKIGDACIYQGKRYIVRGFDPKSVIPQRIYLEDHETAELVVIPIAQLNQSDPDEQPGHERPAK